MSGRAYRPRRLPAGALMLVLCVSIIVAAVLLSLLFLVSNRRVLVERDTMRQTVRRNLFSGVAYAQGHAHLPYCHRYGLDLFGEGRDSVTVEKKPWGAFDVAVVTAANAHFADTAVALLGSQFTAINQAALYLAEERIPLSVGDDAQVRGQAYVANAESAHPANLPALGAPRTGAPITGALHASRPQLPINGDSALARLRDYAALRLQAWLPAGSRTITGLGSRRVSFFGAAMVIFQPEPATLQHLALAGQIVVVSSRRLTVEASAQLDNVLLLAPVVVVKAGFRGRVQIIARDTVEIQHDCELAYPSAVCAYAGTTTPAQVLLGENTRVRGLVVAANATGGGAAATAVVRMAAGAAVEGQVFSTGTVENCGAVRGSVMCRRLIYRTPTSFYNNYLVNAVLDRPGLPAAFLTSPLLNAGAPIGVIAWLH